MRFSRFLLPNLLLLATSAALVAQMTRTCSTAQVMRSGSSLASPVPRTLTRLLTVVQTLANGTVITQTFTIKRPTTLKAVPIQRRSIPCMCEPMASRSTWSPTVSSILLHVSVSTGKRTKIADVQRR
jgi:hypothetical protein